MCEEGDENGKDAERKMVDSHTGNFVKIATRLDETWRRGLDDGLELAALALDVCGFTPVLFCADGEALDGALGEACLELRECREVGCVGSSGGGEEGRCREEEHAVKDHGEIWARRRSIWRREID